ncbi:uncharacterized protein LOC102709193 [Oryza brachyantha]|uniref:uncharacterized protein LOC102709193 n=1 Tax=Oryza brachyantha TaxID=4533 RepID=UPI001ADC72B6|nr:uncharacterized protein LOC102709193 [Oryza brachyantha]
MGALYRPRHALAPLFGLELGRRGSAFGPPKVGGAARRVARPARPSARSIMEGTHRQSSGSYCTVPWCGGCAGNPHGIAEFLLSCNLCGAPLAGRPAFIYNGEKAFCKAECRSRYLEAELRRAREEKRRHASSISPSPELKKTTAAAAAAATKAGEECKEGSIFFICPLDPL